MRIFSIPPNGKICNHLVANPIQELQVWKSRKTSAFSGFLLLFLHRFSQKRFSIGYGWCKRASPRNSRVLFATWPRDDGSQQIDRKDRRGTAVLSLNDKTEQKRRYRSRVGFSDRPLLARSAIVSRRVKYERFGSARKLLADGC